MRGYRLPAAGYLFLRIEDAREGTRLPERLIPDVITAERWDVKPDSGINLAFSYEGLRALGRRRRLAGRLPGRVPRRHGLARGAARRRRRERARALGGLLPQPRRARAGDDQRQGRGGAGRARPGDPRAGGAPRRRQRGRHPARRRAADRPRALRLRRRVLPAGDRGQPLRGPSRRRRARARTATGGRSRPASSSSATPTSRARCPPPRRPTSSAATAPTSSTASCARTSPRSAASSQQAAALYPRRRGAAGRQARRPLARRHAARLLAARRGPGAGGRQVAQQRVRLRARPGGPAVPGRRRTSAA